MEREREVYGEIAVDYDTGGFWGAWVKSTGVFVGRWADVTDAVRYAELSVELAVNAGVWDGGAVELSDIAHAMTFDEW